MRWLALAVTAFVACAPAPAATTPTPAPAFAPDVDLTLWIEPGSHSLTATAVLVPKAPLPGAVRLLLNRSFEVALVDVDGVPAAFAWDDAAVPPPYLPVAGTLVVTPRARSSAAGARVIRVHYSGRVPRPIEDVNMIEPSWVELAAYAAYAPLFPGGPPFTSRLRVTAPANFTIVSRGERVAPPEMRADGRFRFEVWEATIPGIDVPVVASDRLRSETLGNVSVFFRELAPAAARDALGDAAGSLDAIAADLGPPPVAGPLRVVFAPRAGWGYSRTGLIVVSEERHLRRAAAAATAAPPDANAEPADENVHGNAHEISHFWWRIADTQTPHDWLNEALAEYTAARDSRRRSPALYRAWAARYVASLEAKRPAAGILATRSTDRDRYVNWYERGALFFMCTEARFGAASTRRVLVELLALGRARAVTTDDLVGALERASIDRAWVRDWLEDPAPLHAAACAQAL